MQEADDMLDYLDNDKNGKINKIEFCHGLESL